jgi:Transport and Golgi organisation 2
VCTVVVSLAPAELMPVELMGFRDEFTGRPWQPPARHWPGSPLVGGYDEEAGGTWLAVHPAVPRVSCILNARGEQAALSRRRSRGELPLRAATEGPQALRELSRNPGDLASYDPFFLLCADLVAVRMLSWDGRRATLEGLDPATHVITNAGHVYPPHASEGTGPAPPDPQPPSGLQVPPGPQAPPDPQAPSSPQAPPDPRAKAEHFGPKFAAHRPSADPAGTIKDAWGDWLTLAEGDGLSDTDAAAIVVRRELPDGRVWGTTSVSLVALGRDGLRYDFQPVPADATTWYTVDLDRH